jgi:5-formyltetrahydrofolate cyclo-ligase
MLAGNIVQVRLERKALSAAVGPTCCSGREQRSKTASAGSAIPFSMKATLRKQLRAERRALSEPDHWHRSLAAARTIMRLRFFRAGKRVALYLPFDGESDTAALMAAARRRGVQVFVPVISHRRHARLRFYPLTGATVPGEYGISVPRLRLTPISPQWLDLIVIPLVGVDGEGGRLGMGVGIMIEPLRSVGQRTQVKFADAWDLRLDSLATESGVEHFL